MGRVYGEQRDLSYSDTAAFFRARAAGNAHGLSATMYQAEELAVRRDAAEKAIALPLIAPVPADAVLDIGCGNGRWAATLAPRVASYTGIDFSEGLVQAAREQAPAGEFHVMGAHEFRPERFAGARFTLFMLSGILAYLNDADVATLLEGITLLAAKRARIYLREPMGRQERLTLDRFWSEELSTLYSAVYRTRDEYLQLSEAVLAPAEFRVWHEGAPFGPELQNRKDTEQRFLIVGR